MRVPVLCGVCARRQHATPIQNPLKKHECCARVTHPQRRNLPSRPDDFTSCKESAGTLCVLTAMMFHSTRPLTEHKARNHMLQACSVASIGVLVLSIDEPPHVFVAVPPAVHHVCREKRDRHLTFVGQHCSPKQITFLLYYPNVYQDISVRNGF